ncbi:uncharacterized protein A4U43_C09F2310 [Asparagus officinalis]|uniref:Uncharacterized protein n=1 Tax=Asparagus officinalis TaxID=4686 RepID=A0A5P1E9H9_ASPOF|nr:uncharacterized protein LOC109824597 [Asparagus officinalis]ONK57616.1 uncharacterized protein A4U43_C09F2310 [Asparagus officinalis]
MGLGGALRSIIRPLSPSSRQLLPLSRSHQLAPKFSPANFGGGRIQPPFFSNRQLISSPERNYSTSTSSLILGSLTDTRLPKRRPGTAPRRKRASLKPPGPYAWVQYVPGEPIPRSRPNKGSVKGRKEKKRIAQRKAFILSEKKKRKAQFAESKKKKAMERIERKMAAVAREKAWAERLKELQKLEEEKKAAMA